MTLRQLLATWALALGLAACGGGASVTPAPQANATGTLRLSLTDAPTCGYDAVFVTIERIRVHQSSSAGEGDAGWSDVVLDPARRVDLLQLTNGVLMALGQTALPAGKYQQLRLVLAANTAANPLANSVTPAGGKETALTTPSGQTSGLKLNVDLQVAADKVLDVVIDFDACKSIVKRGNSGQFNLKPVLSVVPVLSDAGLRVVGQVAADQAAGTQVSLQLAGVPVKSTVPAANGSFTLYPVPLGTYDLVISGGGRVTAVITGVPVISTAYTVINAPLTSISRPLATLRSVTGSVKPTSAAVRALQVLTGGPTVEVAWSPVDDSSGAFAFSLPIEAPWRATHAPAAATIAFTPDSAAAGLYTVEASTGTVSQRQAIDVRNPVPPLTFNLP
jgi:Domain of unknown function (DUF4382)